MRKFFIPWFVWRRERRGRMGGATATAYSVFVSALSVTWGRAPSRRRRGRTQTKAVTARNWRALWSTIARPLVWLTGYVYAYAASYNKYILQQKDYLLSVTIRFVHIIQLESFGTNIIMVVHHSATSVTMEVDPPRNANSPDDPKTANGSSENEKANDSESSEDGPLDIGEHYLVRRYDDTWREYGFYTRYSRKSFCEHFLFRLDPAGARNVISVCVLVRAIGAPLVRVRVCVRHWCRCFVYIHNIFPYLYYNITLPGPVSRDWSESERTTLTLTKYCATSRSPATRCNMCVCVFNNNKQYYIVLCIYIRCARALHSFMPKVYNVSFSFRF